MRQFFVFTAALVLILSIGGYTQAAEKGHGMMGKEGEKMGQGHEMMKSQKNAECDRQKISKSEMQQKMAPCMQKMQTMVDKMNKMMKADMTYADTEKMADAMMGMSQNMENMSEMMKRGYCTMEEMDKLEKDVSESERRFEALEDYL